MTDFIEIELDDGTRALFQAAESDFVVNHGGDPEVVVAKAAMSRLESIANTTKQLCDSFKDKVKPDELELEIGVGLSGEVGWFFAKSEVEATIKLTMKWKVDA